MLIPFSLPSVRRACSLVSVFGCNVVRHRQSGRRSLPWRRGVSTAKRLFAEFKVLTFGELIANAGSACNLDVQPLNPQQFPDQDRVVFELSSGCLESAGLDVTSTDMHQTSRLTLARQKNGPAEDKQLTCFTRIPVKYDVHLEVSGHRCISVVSMQNEFLQVKSELGHCTISSIQSRNITVNTSGGNIISEGVIQGDISMETKLNGGIRLFKPLSRQLNVKTDAGDIQIGALYADQSVLVTRSGNIDIRNAHRAVDINVKEKGNILINSLDGDLTAKVHSGDVSVYACRHERVKIEVERGNITVKVPADLTACHIDAVGNSVSVDSQLDQSSLSRIETEDNIRVTGTVMKTGSSSTSTSSISAHTASGRVSLVCQDFISSLNLSKFETYDDDEDSD